MADFFEEKKPEAPVEESTEEVKPVTFKVGEKEYSQEDMEGMVGLSSQVKELEEKWNTKMDRLMPEFTQKAQELAELKKAQEVTEVKEIDTKATAGQQLSKEEIKKQALAQADELGIVTEGNISDKFEKFMNARDLVADTKRVVEKMAEDGLPKTDSDTLLDHMHTTGIRDPQKAFNDKFETERDEWKAKKLQEVKKPGLVTESTSTAGSKQPKPVKVTKQNLQELITQQIRGGFSN